MGKPKSSSTSKVKLSNKTTNKRLKSKRKHKLNRSNKPTIVQVPSKSPGKSPGKSSSNQVAKKRIENKSLNVSNCYVNDQLDEELDDNEIAFSDEETLDYVKKNSRRMSLFSEDLQLESTPGRKKSRKSENFYENAPRSFAADKTEEHNSNKVQLLPLKGDIGLIQRTRDVTEDTNGNENVDENENLEDMEQCDENSENPKPNALSYIEIVANHRVDINTKKLKIAKLSQDIIENPDNVGLLKELISLCKKDQVSTIQKLSMLSLVEIFKDLIPSYRIRELTEQEKTIKVSRDVCALREFENSLLSNYQTYLTMLEGFLQICTKVFRKKRTNPISKQNDGSTKTILSLAISSAKCLCELLKSVPQFNFRSNIIAVIVPKVGLSGDTKEIGTICFNAVKSVLFADKRGDVSLEIIKVVHREVKSMRNIKPKLLEILLYLQLNLDAIRTYEEKGNKKDRLMKKKESIMRMSKKEKKKKKFEDQLNKEMQEAEAVEVIDKVGKTHTEILNFLFVIYFRVLKTDQLSSLLPVVLRGLAKYAHLINIDFFEDLMACIEKILKTENIGVAESLNCVYTAMKILSGQGEVLTIDPKQFYCELYSQLVCVSADTNDENVLLAKNCIVEMILKRRKKVSSAQVTGYFKRLATILLQMKSKNVIDYSLVLRNILQVHKKCDHLLDSDTCFSGIFQPEVPDPEYCNAESTSLWELDLMLSHYHPDMCQISKHILNGAPSHGAGSLPSNLLARKRDNEKIDNLIDHFPDSISSKPVKKCFNNTNVDTWKNKNLKSMVVTVVDQ